MSGVSTWTIGTHCQRTRAHSCKCGDELLVSVNRSPLQCSTAEENAVHPLHYRCLQVRHSGHKHGFFIFCWKDDDTDVWRNAGKRWEWGALWLCGGWGEKEMHGCSTGKQTFIPLHMDIPHPWLYLKEMFEIIGSRSNSSLLFLVYLLYLLKLEWLKFHSFELVDMI